MKLVCLSIDGDLELWHKTKHRIGLSNDFRDVWFFDKEEIPDSLYGIGKSRFFVLPIGIEHGPEFWGREVLGEL